MRCSWQFTEQVVAYERRHGDGRVVHIGLGHGSEAYASEDVQKQFAKNHVFVPSNKKAWKTYQDNEPPKHASSFIHSVYGRPHACRR